MNATVYNFDRHSAGLYQLDELEGPRLGQAAVDFEAPTLDGIPVKLSDYYGKIIVLENGSVTCPQYVANITPMNKIAQEFPDVEFLLLYTREAHPGERIRQHKSLDDKAALAQRARDRFNENRTILIDDMRGSAHLAYGSLPDMIYIIAPDGTVAFRGKWNNAKTVRKILQKLLNNESVADLRSPFRIPSPMVMMKAVMPAGGVALFDLMRCAPKVMWMHLKEEASHGFR